MTDIKRAVDEEAVRILLADCYESFSELDTANIALVCTQSDVSKRTKSAYRRIMTFQQNIDDNTMRHLKSRGINVDHIKAMNKSLAVDRRELNKLVADIRKLGTRAPSKMQLQQKDRVE